MIKYSVRKPFTVIVAVIVIMLIGAVALMRMETSLLPDMDLPYMVVITTYPGATPEKVEETVTKPLESTLGTVSAVEQVTSVSAENYSAITLEFTSGTDMDSAMVKVSSAVNQTTPYLPEEVGTPNIMEISMDMMATVYAAVSYDGKNIYELSDFAEDKVIPSFERISGVANVEASGLVEERAELHLVQDKIDRLNKRIRDKAEKKFDEAEEDLTGAEEELKDAEDELDSQESKLDGKERELENTQRTTTEQLSEAALALDQAEASVSAYGASITSLEASKTALSTERQAYIDNDVTGKLAQVEEMFAGVKQLVQGIETTGLLLGIDVASYGLDSSKLPGSVAEVIEKPGRLEQFKKQVEALGNPELQATLDALASQAELLGNTDLKDLAKAVKKTANAAGAGAAALDAASLQQLYEIVHTRLPQIDGELANLEIELTAARAVYDEVQKKAEDLDENYRKAEAGKIEAAAGFGSGAAQLAAGMMQIEAGRDQLTQAKEELEKAREQFEDSKKAVLDTANLDQLLTLDALSGLIYAQNFAMPAGYIDSTDGETYMLKIGENYPDPETLSSMLLTHIDEIGDIRLSDVAELSITDNAGDSYAKVNGERGVVLSIFKGSTAGTSKVSDLVQKVIKDLEAEYPGLHVVRLVDQGDYIDMVIRSIFQSMLIGAGLAVLILAIFLFDIRPTLVVAFSIPFSILTAIVIMYFTGVSINMMSLFGLSLAVGMLVDNSIVVIENIYRLRYKGLPSSDAAVHGTKQVAGAIISSTLTTICVFFPIVFTSGLVRQLMLPFSLTITFALTASLLVAMTVVPVMGAGLLQKAKPREHKIFDRVQDFYGRILAFCLRFKIVPLGIAVALLAVCVYAVLSMGIVLLPEAGSEQITLSAEIPEEDDRETAYKKADQIVDAVISVPEAAYIGVMDGSSSGMGGSFLSSRGGSDYHSISAYIIPAEDCDTIDELNKLVKDLNLAVENIDAEVSVSNSMMGQMTTMLGSGLEIDISGTSMDSLKTASEQVMEVLNEVPGFKNVKNGMEDTEPELRLLIDKDKARRCGVTEAQLYQLIAEKLTTEKTAVTLSIDDRDMDVVIYDENHELTKENLLSLEFEETVKNDDGTTETKTHKLREVARLEVGESMPEINRSDGNRQITVTAESEDGYFVMLQRRQVEEKLKNITLPGNTSWSFGGEVENTVDMLSQMVLLIAVGAILIYLVMVAQFQSLLGPFIVIFTVPLAFTGGLLGMLVYGSQLSLVSLMGFLVLMGTVVNNGIVFVDYSNKLWIHGLEKREALIETGKTRMRPILMTALTTILAMMAMVFSQDAGNDMSKEMAIVVAVGLLYATLMTLFIVPVLYDIFYRKKPRVVEFTEVSDDLRGDIV